MLIRTEDYQLVSQQTATATITVLRNQFTPLFINPPTTAAVARTGTIGQPVATVSATDSDTQVNIYAQC